MATSQNGFTASPDPSAIGVQRMTVPGTDVKLNVRGGDIGRRLMEMARWWQENVEPLKPGECHGWVFRPIAGTNVLSNHASGTAIDLNAPQHPQGARGTVPGHLRDDISAKAASLGLRWGGNFTGSSVDEMHFEVLRGGGGGGGSARPTLRRGSKGPVVRELQTLLNRGGAGLVVDGLFGPRTDAAVRDFQRRKRLAVDGIVGPQTWGALLA